MSEDIRVRLESNRTGVLVKRGRDSAVCTHNGKTL